jgi:hypothetical protein
MKFTANLKARGGYMTAVLLLGMFTLPSHLLADDSCGAAQTQPVGAENGSTVSGRGTLVVNDEEVEVSIRAENLTPGVAYTAWFIYFDNTGQCIIPRQCGGPDLTSPATNPTGVFGRMDSGVAGDNGKLTFKGSIRDFHVSAGSAIHVALFAHGPANTTDNRERARQLLTPQAPGLGAPGLGLVTQKGFLVAGAMFDIDDCNAGLRHSNIR